MLVNYIIKNRFYDSVLLMQIANDIKSKFGFEKVSVMMGTLPNKDLMRETCVLADEGEAAGANDVIVAFGTDKEEDFKKAFEYLNDLLEKKKVKLDAGGVNVSYSTIESAFQNHDDANTVFISLPGPFVRYEAQKAVNLGMNVMIFSDNVSLEDEIALKKAAEKKGVIVMGPDCGTAIIKGSALGFANVIPQGPVGIAGASGTGIQELMVLLADRGIGVSHALGTGGRDVSEAVGGIALLQALRALGEDESTKIIAVISKPPCDKVVNKMLKELERISKPAVVCFMKDGELMKDYANIRFAATIEDEVGILEELIYGAPYKKSLFSYDKEVIDELVCRSVAALNEEQKYIRGLYSGGTLCDEALMILNRAFGNVWSNASLYPDRKLKDAKESKEHSLVDMGDDEFTRGMPHPMIDFTLRKERLIKEVRQKDVAVILLDVVLGYGSHMNPAGELAEVIRSERALALKEGRDFVVCAYVCGSEGDPQKLAEQKKILEDAGVILMPSNAQAARFCVLVAGRGKITL